MCWRSSLEHPIEERVRATPGRSLLGWLRDLWRRPRPQEEAEVVPFPTRAAGARGGASPGDSEAA